MDLYRVISNKVADSYKDCPLELENLDPNEGIRVLGNRVKASEEDIKRMDAQGIKCFNPQINHIQRFSVDALYQWITRNPTNPLTRRSFTGDEIKRIKFRHENNKL